MLFTGRTAYTMDVSQELQVVNACCAADNAYIPVGQFAWVNEGWIGTGV